MRYTEEQNPEPDFLNHAWDLSDWVCGFSCDEDNTFSSGIGVCCVYDCRKDTEEASTGSSNSSILNPRTLCLALVVSLEPDHQILTGLFQYLNPILSPDGAPPRSTTSDVMMMRMNARIFMILQ